MTAPPQFGDAIEVGGVRPAWLPDGVEIDWTWDAHYAADRDWNGTGTPASMVAIASGVSAIRLEVPRYDFVYLALERGMVPNMGASKEAPADYDRSRHVLFSDGTVKTGHAPDWEHRKGMMRCVIGYHATSTALPLAHPAAPQGEEIERHLEAADYLIDLCLRLWRGEPVRDLAEATASWKHSRAALAALAPAAIASGREGAE